MSRVRYVLVGLVVLAGLAALKSLVPSSSQGSTIRFSIQKGDSALEISQNLEAQHLTSHPWVFRGWVKLLGAKGIRPGTYTFSSEASSLSYYRQMQKGPPLVRITFPEGWMAKQMAALLETREICSATDFMSAVHQGKKEGYLFPDTYFFEQGSKADRIIARLVQRFEEKRPADFAARARELKLTEPQLVTLASIIEREARAPQERPIISGVFHNRLKKRWYLESCATVEYALGAWKPRLLYKDLNVQSPYNTYRHPGLPPGPICNPGVAALEAAIHPAETDMMYFVADGQGTHRFSRYYKDHIAAKKKK